MKQLNEYIKEGLFDNVDKLEGKNGLESTSKQIEKEIKAWICEHYFDSQSCAKSRAIKKAALSVDTSTTPPTVNYNWSGHLPSIYIVIGTKSLCNNGMFQWGEMNIFDMNINTDIEDIIGSPKKVKGNFIIHSEKLKSLEGAPEEVYRDFDCRRCESLKSLEYAPKYVGGSFYCSSCTSLTNLKGSPKKVGKCFDCSYCESLKSLEGSPEEVGGWFDCIDCPQLKSLKGGPNKVGETFRIGPWLKSNCSLESLEGAPKILRGNFICYAPLSKEEINKGKQLYGANFKIFNDSVTKYM